MRRKAEEALESAWLNAQQELTEVATRIEELERELAQARKATTSLFNLRITYICAHCGTFAEVPFLAVEVFDSGTTLLCDKCGEATVFDLSTPAQGGKE